MEYKAYSNSNGCNKTDIQVSIKYVDVGFYIKMDEAFILRYI